MGTPRADIHDGPELVNAPPERSKIRRQSDVVLAVNLKSTTTSLRARHGPAAARGGALRAAVTRARVVVWAQLCHEGHLLRDAHERKTKETYRCLLDRCFLLDGGVQIPMLACS
jgi:hypothetical protein